MEESFRLCGAYVPEDYTLDIFPNIPEKVYDCVEVIKFQKNGESDYADLFAGEVLKIKSISQNGKPMKYTHEGQRLKIFKEDGEIGTVKIEFTGTLDMPAVSLYYINDKCFSSQFEALHARKAFPCFDEPCVKSTFTINVTVPKDLTALSNMPPEMIINHGDTREWRFHKTPAMCTYLLALAVGEFELKSGFTKRGVPVDIYALPGKTNLMDFALDEATNVIDWFEEFLRVPFPLPRMQLLAVPEFQAGAMENYGLLIFREECLLADPKTSSVNTLKWVAEVIAHEIAHQWSGDAVSPISWDALWLNEGFATIFPFIAFQYLHPEWDSWNVFLGSTIKKALVIDESEHTHPIHVEVKTDAEVEGVFDEISYSKAASVIRMLMTKLGIESFRNALSVYFKTYNNKNATTSDLCKIFTDVLGVDMQPFFDAWTLQKNYPIVILEDDGTLHQKRYTITGIHDDRFWPLPLCLAQSKNGVVTEKTIELGKDALKLDTDCDWIVINKGCTSLCRVLQKGEYFRKMVRAVSTLDAVDRWALLNNYSGFAQSGLISFAEVIELLKSYEDESDCLVATEVAATLKTMMGFFPQHKDKLNAIAVRVFKNILNKIGKTPVEGESSDIKELRSTLYQALAITCGDKESIDELKPMWDQFLEDKTKIDGNMYALIMRVGNMYFNGYETILEMTRSEPNPELKGVAVDSLGFCPEDKIDECLEACMKTQIQDVTFALVGAARSPLVGRRMWDFLVTKWSTIFEWFGSLMFNIALLINTGTACLNTKEDAESIKNFFAANPCAVADMTIRQAIEKIQNRAEIIAKDSDNLAKVL